MSAKEHNNQKGIISMKKSMFLAMLALPAMAGEPAPVAVAPVPAPVAPACDCPVSWELAAVYRYATRDLFVHGEGNQKDIDTYGVDLTAVYGLNDRWSANLRFGYTFGDEVNRMYDIREETDVHTFYLMPGLRYTAPLNDKWSVYGGANVGIANECVKNKVAFSLDNFYDKNHDSDWGVAFSVEAGVRYKVSDSTELFAAYEFYGSTAAPKLYDGHTDTHGQTYHGLRAGVSISF